LINDPPQFTDREKVIVQKSRGDILVGEANLPAPIKSGEISWREETD
jgi:hypothetical protein